ncbi:hypothetical protein LCGC14_1331290 [marine sediment metagenome]|uniref:Uncharacterized protein n=1 Tax=marine sediment metagenome TaxID=412755 RepID=A0A0F9L2J3_9ZZZZ
MCEKDDGIVLELRRRRQEVIDNEEIILEEVRDICDKERKRIIDVRKAFMWEVNEILYKEEQIREILSKEYSSGIDSLVKDFCGKV